MSRSDVALALAAFFTFGCISIHEARAYARAMTLPLTIGVVGLGFLAGLLVLAERPEALDRIAAVRMAAVRSQ